MQTNLKALAFFDLDGTLLNAKSQVDPEVVEALGQIRQKGVLPIIATGRGHFELRKIMTDTSMTGAITMNGQYIVLDGQCVYKQAIPTAVISKLLEKVQQHNESLAFYDSEHYWVSELTDFTRRAYAYTHAELPSVDATRYLTHEVNMLLVLTDKLSRVEEYKQKVPELNFFMNTPSSIDVTNTGTNKGTGVERLKQILGLPHIPTHAFGDGRNDLHLLAACDYKTAMGNAVPELKALAGYVTAANTEGGIIKAFQHWGWM